MAGYRDDPVFLDSRREAIFILCLWCSCFFWTICWCYHNGYVQHASVPGHITEFLPDHTGWDRDPATLVTPLGLGIPDWVFWGIAVPWVLCIVISMWFCFWFMRDDEEQIRAATDDGNGASP